jgi:putative tricarboxylic transport membrane protein
MEKMDIPLAPAVLAVILGPMAEMELRRSLLISQGDYGFLFSSSISLVLVGLILVMLLSPLVKKLIKRKASPLVPKDLASQYNND